MSIKKFVLISAFALAASLMQAQSNQTITGTITDSMCGKKHMMKNATAAQCTRECVKSGSTFTLVSGGNLYTLKGEKPMLDKWAGQSVTIQGKLDGTTITVETMSAK